MRLRCLQRALVLSLLAAGDAAMLTAKEGFPFPEYRSDRWVDEHFEWKYDGPHLEKVSEAAEINALVLMGKDAYPLRTSADRWYEPYFSLSYDDLLWEYIKETLTDWDKKGIIQRRNDDSRGTEARAG